MPDQRVELVTGAGGADRHHRVEFSGRTEGLLWDEAGQLLEDVVDPGDDARDRAEVLAELQRLALA